MHMAEDPEEDPNASSTKRPDLRPPPKIRSGEPNSIATLLVEKGGALSGTGMVQVKMMHHAGRSSARSTLETEIYALGAGEVDSVASVITFDPEERTKIADLLSAVPEDIRTKYQTPERIVAFLFMGGPRMEMLRVVTETPARDDVAVELIEFKFSDDPTVRKEDMIFFKDPGGWKSVVPSAQIERITRTLHPISPQ